MGWEVLALFFLRDLCCTPFPSVSLFFPARCVSSFHLVVADPPLAPPPFAFLKSLSIDVEGGVLLLDSWGGGTRAESGLCAASPQVFRLSTFGYEYAYAYASVYVYMSAGRTQPYKSERGM